MVAQEPNYMLVAAAVAGGLLLILFLWTFMSNAQFGLTMLAVKETTGFFPFVGTFFLYTLGFYFIVFFVAVVIGEIYIYTHPPQQSVPVQ
jgi:hypothetical protein